MSIFADWAAYSDYPNINIVLPMDSSGALSFTSDSDPVIGHAVNQGTFPYPIPSKLNISMMKYLKV